MTNETIISALREARAVVHNNRTELADAHTHPVTNLLDADGQAGVAEYDVVLRQIDDALASAEAQQPCLSELCQSIGAQLGSNWLVVGPDGSRFSAETPHRAANAASRHLSAMLYDPAKLAEMRAALDDLRQKAEQRDAELMEQFGSLNCPACGGSGHVDDASPQPAAQQPEGKFNRGDETAGTVKRFGWDCTSGKPEIMPATNGAFVWYDDYVKLLHKAEAAQQPVAVPHVWVSDQYGGEFDDMTAGQGYRKGWNDCRAAMLAAAPQAPSREPLHIGACITGGQLHTTVMQRDARGHVHVLATAEMNVERLKASDCVAEMVPAAPQAPSREPLTIATDAVVREKARIHFQEGRSWRGCWNPEVEQVTQLVEAVYRRGWGEAEAFYGITKEGGKA